MNKNFSSRVILKDIPLSISVILFISFHFKELEKSYFITLSPVSKYMIF